MVVNDTATNEETKNDSITTPYGFSQIIFGPTFILLNYSCFYFSFTSQPNLVVESGVYPSLYLNCQHQIVFAKLSLKTEYPPLYKCFIWDYKNANGQVINRTIENFIWEKSFEDENVHHQVLFI